MSGKALPHSLQQVPVARDVSDDLDETHNARFVASKQGDSSLLHQRAPETSQEQIGPRAAELLSHSRCMEVAGSFPRDEDYFRHCRLPLLR